MRVTTGRFILLFLDFCLDANLLGFAERTQRGVRRKAARTASLSPHQRCCRCATHDSGTLKAFFVIILGVTNAKEPSDISVGSTPRHLGRC